MMKTSLFALGILGCLGSLQGCRAQEQTSDPVSVAPAIDLAHDASTDDTFEASELALPLSFNANCAENTSPLNAKTWVEHEIQTMAVINSLGEPSDPKPIPSNMAQFKICGPQGGDCAEPDLVVNGAFHARQGLIPVKVAGATMRHGRVDPGASSFTLPNRGGTALLDNGKIVICRPSTPNAYVANEDIDRNCVPPDSPAGTHVTDFMGGGAYLIRNGLRACSGDDVKGNCDKTADLAKVQDFNQLGPGIKSEQMHSALHMVIATRRGKASVLWPLVGVTGAQIQNQLCAAGYDQVVMYDGGSGFVVFGKDLPARVGINPTAFLLKLKAPASP